MLVGMVVTTNRLMKKKTFFLDFLVIFFSLDLLMFYLRVRTFISLKKYICVRLTKQYSQLVSQSSSTGNRKQTEISDLSLMCVEREYSFVGFFLKRVY